MEKITLYLGTQFESLSKNVKKDELRRAYNKQKEKQSQKVVCA